jgi:CRP-like cAMP-binding protein
VKSPAEYLPSKRAMSKASQQQDVAVLLSAKNGLIYLTPNDWTLIADKAARMEFKPGDYIVHQGRRTNGLYLVLKGTASVEIPPSRIIGPGEACGEISLIDDLPGTANVIADQTVEAYYLDRPTLQSLFELFPHLGSRFYRSLAAILSRRLRELISKTPPGKKESLKSDAR